MSGTMSSRMSPERSRLAGGRYGSTLGSGTIRKRTEPTRKAAGMPNSRVSWSGGDEGDGRGPSDPGADQVPRSRRPDPPPPVPRFNQRVYRPADDADDNRVRRWSPRSGDDRRARCDGAGHGTYPLRRRRNPRHGVPSHAVSDG